MASALRKTVRERANGCCEYCQIPESCTDLPHTIDHIRARKHSGPTSLANTCWCCAQCNGAKSSNAAGFDPVTDNLVPLFNPRKDTWRIHFHWKGSKLIGISAVGRATIEVLGINAPARIQHRRLFMAAGRFFKDN